MKRAGVSVHVLLGAWLGASFGVPSRISLHAQRPTNPVLERIRVEGMERSRLEPLAFALIDSIGPRLTGSPGGARAQEWLTQRYAEWGIESRREQYGTWPGWRRGPTHVAMLAPRVQTIDAHLRSFSDGFKGTVRVAALPMLLDSSSIARWMAGVRGKFVLFSPEPLSCRPPATREKNLRPAEISRMIAAEGTAGTAWARQITSITGRKPDSVYAMLKRAGAAGVLVSGWSGGWGTQIVVGTPTLQLPAIAIGCEDYGLMVRLARRGLQPELRISADAEQLGPVPATNTIATLRGKELPDEYVVLSAHIDSWDGASGATDNGSGTLVMLEAMRILRAVYPNPRRTILAGHWNGEETGLNGSQAFTVDHPEVVRGTQVLFNQDNGTGRIVDASMQAFTQLGDAARRWLAAVPASVTDSVRVDDPGLPGGNSDYASFTCHGAPAITLGSMEFDYSPYTWHTTLDTFDKLSFDDLRRNATLVAMLAYLASEEPARLGRARLTQASRPGERGGYLVLTECPEPDRTGRRDKIR